jgi:hypothetical protein
MVETERPSTMVVGYTRIAGAPGNHEVEPARRYSNVSVALRFTSLVTGQYTPMLFSVDSH